MSTTIAFAFSTPLRHWPSQTKPHKVSRCQRPSQVVSLFDFSKLWSSKPDDSKPILNFIPGYTYLAHPEKNTGEDAFFIEGNSAGVFDGVSGAFETRGVDPRLYSQTLALLTRNKVREYGPQKVVRAAIDASLQNRQEGASTACVIGMDAFGRLFGINLGDSGVRIVRNGKIAFRTKEQQHFFNCPYQLGTDSSDRLAMGQNVQQKLREGDVVVLATDGLFDNMNDKDIVAVVEQEEDEMMMAEKLGEMASTRSVDTKFASPFMLAAKKAGVKWKGGKADDITVICLRVVEDDVEGTSLLSMLPEMADME